MFESVDASQQTKDKSDVERNREIRSRLWPIRSVHISARGLPERPHLQH